MSVNVSSLNAAMASQFLYQVYIGASFHHVCKAIVPHQMRVHSFIDASFLS
jgi:hypothetical protein